MNRRRLKEIKKYVQLWAPMSSEPVKTLFEMCNELVQFLEFRQMTDNGVQIEESWESFTYNEVERKVSVWLKTHTGCRSIPNTSNAALRNRLLELACLECDLPDWAQVSWNEQASTAVIDYCAKLMSKPAWTSKVYLSPKSRQWLKTRFVQEANDKAAGRPHVRARIMMHNGKHF